MKVRAKGGAEQAGDGADFPSASQLAALRAWYAGLTARAAVAQYLGQGKATGQSSRVVLGDIRRQLASYARARHRDDLASLMEHPAAEREQRARAVSYAIEKLRNLPVPAPLVTDAVDRWLPGRAARALKNSGIQTLADLTVRVPRRRRWWAAVPGLGARSARRVEEFFAAHPTLTERARALVIVPRTETSPWEHLVVPREVDGSQGAFRAPQASALPARKPNVSCSGRSSSEAKHCRR
jgi:hypothetical protein